jgi:hypothetical protein
MEICRLSNTLATDQRVGEDPEGTIRIRPLLRPSLAERRTVFGRAVPPAPGSARTGTPSSKEAIMSAIHRTLSILPVGLLLLAGCADVTGPGSRIATALDRSACGTGTLGFDDYSLGWPTRGALTQPALSLTPVSVAPTDVELLQGAQDVRVGACQPGIASPGAGTVAPRTPPVETPATDDGLRPVTPL